MMIFKVLLFQGLVHAFYLEFINWVKYIFVQTAGELSKKWSTMIGEEHIPLGQYMAAYALKVILRTIFGNFYLDDKEIVAFGRHFDVVRVHTFLWALDKHGDTIQL